MSSARRGIRESIDLPALAPASRAQSRTCCPVPDMTDPTRTYSLEPHPEYGFLQIHPTPSLEEITRFYVDEFYSTKYPAFNNSALEVQEADREFHDAHRQDICDVIEAVSGRALAGQSVLDVGCGWGHTLLYFASKGALKIVPGIGLVLLSQIPTDP